MPDSNPSPPVLSMDDMLARLVELPKRKRRHVLDRFNSALSEAEHEAFVCPTRPHTERKHALAK